MNVSGMRRGLPTGGLVVVFILSVLGFLPGTSTFAAAPAASKGPNYSKPVAVFWVGVDRGANVLPPVNVNAMISIYETNHFRVVRFDGTSPRVMGLSLVIDRQKHPENYLGSVVPFIIHGNGLVTNTGFSPEVAGPNSTPRQVTQLELASAFLVGIGGDAQADVSEAACLVGGQCREIPLIGTPLEQNVYRWLTLETDPSKAKTLAATQTRTNALLGRLLDTLLVAVRAVSPQVTASSDGDEPNGFRPFTYRVDEGNAPAPKGSALSFTELAEREALMKPVEAKVR